MIVKDEQNKSPEHLLGDVASEFFGRLAAGESPRVEEYAEKYPAIAEQIRLTFPALELVGDSLSSSGDSMSPRAEDPERTQKRIGDFTIVREIGRGGMGIVYEAQQISMGRKVALKVLPLAALARERGIQRFHNEVRAAAALDHPNIVSVYSVGEERGVHYYAMRLIRGQTLAAVIAELSTIQSRNTPLTGDSISQVLSAADQQASDSVDPDAREHNVPDGNGRPDHHGATERHVPAHISTASQTDHDSRFFRSAAELGVQAAEALQHAHDHGVLHRDIKPGNFMLDAEGQLYVTDFGLARIESDVGMTMTGDLVGTLRYMSPEQALGKRVVVDHRCDIYSLGVTLYELFSLRPPFDGENRQELLRQIAFEDPPKLRQINRSIPAELQTIVLKAIEKNPDQRYNTAEELASDLRAFLEDRPIKAKPPTSVQRVAKWSRRHSTLVRTALATLAAAIAIGGALLWRERSRTLAALHAEYTQRLLAEDSTAKAERASERARQALTAETQARRDAQQNLYRAHIREAQQAIENGNTSRAEKLLYRYLPESDKREFRGWEWYYLLEQLDGGSEIVGMHPSGVREVCYSPDGHQFVTVSSKFARVWDAATRKMVHELHFPYGQLKGVSYSPDGRRVAIDAYDGTLRLWTLGDTGMIRTLRPSDQFRKSSVKSAPVWSPDGQTIASCFGRHVILWDVGRGIEASRIGLPHPAHTASWSPDGKKIAVGASGTLYIFDVETHERRLVADLHGYNLWCIDWKSDSTQLATGSFNMHAKIVDAESGETVHDFYHPSGVTDVKFSPNEDLLACATTGQEIYLWESRTGKFDRKFTGHRKWVDTIDWSPDGRHLISGGIDNTVRIWPISGGNSLPGNPVTVTNSYLQNRNVAVLVTENGDLQVYDLIRHKVLFAAGVGRPIWSQLGDKLAVQHNRVVRVLDGTTGSELSTFLLPEQHRLNAAGWSGDGALLLTRNDSELSIWDTSNWTEHHRLDVPRFTSATWSPREKLLAVLADRQVQIWDVARKAQIAGFRESHNNVPIPLRWSPDGSRIATGASGFVNIWDSYSGRLLHRLSGHRTGKFMSAIEWSQDGSLLASGGWDHTVKVWDTISGSEVFSLDGHNGKISSVVFDPTTSRLASGAYDGTLKLWDVDAGEELISLETGHENPKLIWSSDGCSLLSLARMGRGVAIFDTRRSYEMESSGELDRRIARWQTEAAIRLAESGRVVESSQAMELAEQHGGPQPVARCRRATCFLMRGMEAEAQQDLELACNSNTAYLEAHNDLAWLLANAHDEQFRDPERAEQIARDLVADWPEQYEFWTTLGSAQYRQGKWREAIESLRRAERFNFRRASAVYLLMAMSQTHIGNRKEAKEAMKQDHHWREMSIQYHDPHSPGTLRAQRLREEAENLIGEQLLP